MSSMASPSPTAFVFALALAAVGLSPKLRAEISVPAYFSEHMMLQAGTAASIWGWADPGEGVSATFFGRVRAHI